MKFFVVFFSFCLTSFATDAPTVEEANGSDITITFPDAATLQSYIATEGKNFAPPKGNFFAQLGFPPPKDKIGTLWYDAILASFAGKVMTHQEFIVQLSRAHCIVYDAIIRETEKIMGFLANGTSALWCQQFYKMTMPEKYWDHSMHFLRILEVKD